MRSALVVSLIVSFGLGCAAAKRAPDAVPPAPARPRDRAIQDPCSVLAALMGPAPGRGDSPVVGASVGGGLKALFRGGCDLRRKGGLQPGRMPPLDSRLYIDNGRELIGPNDSCPNGHRGARLDAQYAREYYLIVLHDRPDGALAFEVVHALSSYSRRSKKWVDAIATCSSFEGELR